MARDGNAGKMGSTPSGYGGLGSSGKPSPIRTPEGVARCHYRIPAPMALPRTATIWTRFSATWGRNCADSPSAHRRSKTFERFEGELHQIMAVAERALLAHELEQLDVDRPAVTIAGQRHHRVLRSTATYTSAVGPVSVLRTLYRTGCEPAVVPLELRAGIIEGHWTPRAAHQASYLVAHLTPQEAADTLRELGNMSPSKSSLDRLPKLLSSRWEEHRAEFEEVLRAQQSVPCAATTVAVSLDGVMAPMKDGARQAKRAATRAAGRPTKGPAGLSGSGLRHGVILRRRGTAVEYVACGRMPEARRQP